MPRAARGRPRGRTRKRTRRDFDEPANHDEIVLDSINVEPPDNTSHEPSPTAIVDDPPVKDTPAQDNNDLTTNNQDSAPGASSGAPSPPASSAAPVTDTATAAEPEVVPDSEPVLAESNSHEVTETPTETRPEEQEATAMGAGNDLSTARGPAPETTAAASSMEVVQDTQEPVAKEPPVSEPSSVRQGTPPVTDAPVKRDVSQDAQAVQDKESATLSGSPPVDMAASSEMDIDAPPDHGAGEPVEPAANKDKDTEPESQMEAIAPPKEAEPSTETRPPMEKEPPTKTEPESPVLTEQPKQQAANSGDRAQTMTMPSSAGTVRNSETVVTTEAKSTEVVQTPGKSLTPSETPTSSVASSSHRKYKPQFSEASDMILKRIKMKANTNANANAASNASSPAPTASNTEQAPKSENVLKLPPLIMSMPVPAPAPASMSMPMPRAMPMPQRPIAKSSLTNRDAFQLRLPQVANPPIPSNVPIQPMPSNPPLQPIAPHPHPQPHLHPQPRPLAPKTKIIIKAREKGQKRKRDPDDSDASQESGDLSDADSPKISGTPTMTKSGRQVQKPTQYKPLHAPITTGSMSPLTNQKRKAQPLQPEPDQALCKVCTRILSPQANQIVFCDGCNFGWHQLCHEPCIDTEYVSDESRSWFCRGCSAKRERHLARKKTLEGFKGVSWGHKSHDQRRSYLSRLSNTQVVNLLMYTLEMHPDLPIFPMPDSGGGGGGGGGGSSAVQPPAAFSRQYSSSIAMPAAGGSSHSAKSHHQHANGTASASASAAAAAMKNGGEPFLPPRRRMSVDADMPAAWPRVGQGCLANLAAPPEDDLQDRNDFEAFSVTTYDAAGRKTAENGMLVGPGPGSGLK